MWASKGSDGAATVQRAGGEAEAAAGVFPGLDSGVLADAARLSERLAKHRRRRQMLSDELFRSFKDMESQTKKRKKKKKKQRSWAEIEAEILAEEERLVACESEMAQVPGRLFHGQEKQAIHFPFHFSGAEPPLNGFSDRLTSIFPSPRGPVALQCATWSRGIAKRHRCVSAGEVAERILLDGHTLSSVLQEFEGQDVLVYQEGDFADTQLDQLCKGRPVFAKEGEGVTEDTVTPYTRDWAKHTARVLESGLPLDPLCDLIRSGNLRFLAQQLEHAVEGARALIQASVMVFEEEDFEDILLMTPELRKVMLGRPVFLPEKGCEYVQAMEMLVGKTAGAPRRWPSTMAHLVSVVPELADGILSGSIPLDGRRWTEIPLAPLPVWDEEPTARHLFPSRHQWEASYTARRAIRVADFPDLGSLPDWVGNQVSGSAYLALLRRTAMVPLFAGGRRPLPPSVRDRPSGPEPGYYNLKHFSLEQTMLSVILDPSSYPQG